ncbi:MAG: hypothetical protein WAL20_07335, partial [Rhodomicrobium sp.]
SYIFCVQQVEQLPAQLHASHATAFAPGSLLLATILSKTEKHHSVFCPNIKLTRPLISFNLAQQEFMQPPI